MGVQGFAGMVEAIQSQSYSQKEVFHYFYKLGRSDDEEVSFFEGHWKSLGIYDLNRADLVMSLHSIAKKVTQDSESKDKYEGVVQTIREHKSVWENEALHHVGQFDKRDLAMTLWAFAAMGIAPSEKFMTAMRERAETVFNNQDARFLRGYLWTLAMVDRFAPNAKNKEHYEQLRPFIQRPNDNRSRKNTHDADLWFRGESSVVNPSENKTQSGGALDLKEAFEHAGYIVEEDTSPISQLPQAINLVVSKPGVDNELYIEVDSYDSFLNTGTDEHQQLFYKGCKVFRSGLIEKFTPDKHVLYMGPDMVDLFKRVAQADETISPDRKPLSDRLCDTIFNAVVNKRESGVYRARDDSRRSGTKYYPPVVDKFFVSKLQLECVH